jgi:hypothetical protein
MGAPFSERILDQRQTVVSCAPNAKKIQQQRYKVIKFTFTTSLHNLAMHTKSRTVRVYVSLAQCNLCLSKNVYSTPWPHIILWQRTTSIGYEVNQRNISFRDFNAQIKAKS